MHPTLCVCGYVGWLGALGTYRFQSVPLPTFVLARWLHLYSQVELKVRMGVWRTIALSQ